MQLSRRSANQAGCALECMPIIARIVAIGTPGMPVETAES
jgi:hypothetical protein